MTWDELKKCGLVVYTTTWCPDCTRFKSRLSERGLDRRGRGFTVFFEQATLFGSEIMAFLLEPDP